MISRTLHRAAGALFAVTALTAAPAFAAAAFRARDASPGTSVLREEELQPAGAGESGV